ncbi:hypothetical protein ACHAXT_001507 [Thalassiosira profunda]
MSSVGGREIEAAKRRVGAAKAQKAAASSMLDAAHEMAAEAKKLAETAKAMSATAEKNKSAAKALLQSSDKELQDAEKFLRESEKRLEVIDVDAETEQDNGGKKKRKAPDYNTASSSTESDLQPANNSSGGQTSAASVATAEASISVNRIEVVGTGDKEMDVAYKRVMDMNDNEFGFFLDELCDSRMIFREGEHWFIGHWHWELTFGRRKEGRRGYCNTKYFRTRDPCSAALPPRTGWIAVSARFSTTEQLQLNY